MWAVGLLLNVLLFCKIVCVELVVRFTCLIEVCDWSITYSVSFLKLSFITWERSWNNGSGPSLNPEVEQIRITLSISKPDKDLLKICKQLPILGMTANLDSDSWWKAFIFIIPGIRNSEIFDSIAVVFRETIWSVFRLILEVSMKCSLNSKFVCHRASASILLTGSSWRAIWLVVMRGRVLLSKSKQIL